MKKSCLYCKYYDEDYSTGTSKCNNYDNMTEEEIEKYYTNGQDDCPCFHDLME